MVDEAEMDGYPGMYLEDEAGPDPGGQPEGSAFGYPAEETGLQPGGQMGSY